MASFLSTIVPRRLFSPAGYAAQPSFRQLLLTPSIASRAALSTRSTSTHVSGLNSALWKTLPRTGKKRIFSFLAKGVAVAGIGIGLSNFQKPPIQCDAPQSMKTVDPIYPEDRSPPPVSSVSLYELGFGTVTGICAGVFVKKGAKAVAWFLGGIFVLLQYMGSASLVRVDWGKVSSKFENLFYTKDATGGDQASQRTFLVDLDDQFLDRGFPAEGIFRSRICPWVEDWIKFSLLTMSPDGQLSTFLPIRVT